MIRAFRGLGRIAVRHRWKVVVLWVAILVVGAVFAPRLQEVFEREFVTGQTGESQRAADVVAEEFTSRSAFQQQLVLTSDSYTVDEPEYREAAEGIIARLDTDELVARTNSFFSTGEDAFVSADRRTTYALLDLKATAHIGGVQAAGDILDAVEAAPTPGWLTATATGAEAVHADITAASKESVRKAETIGLPVAMVVLIVVFGALVAATLPLLLAVLTIVIALAMAFAVGQLMDLSVVLETFVVMLGLALGIDYALFMLTRYRAERRAGRDIPAAAVEMVTHAGKAIAFSGLAVLIGLSALLATADPTSISFGIGGMLVVVVAVAAGLTLLPAIIVLLGDRIEAPRTLTGFLGRTQRDRFWRWWGPHLMRRPLRYLVMGVVVMGALAFATTDIKLGSLGAKVLGEDYQSRQGYETLAKEFGEGLMSPVQVVVRSDADVGDPAVVAGVDRLTRAIEADPRFVGAMSMTSLVPDLGLPDYQALYADGFREVPEEMAAHLSEMVNLEGDRDTTMVLGFLASDPASSEAWDTAKAVRSEIVPTVPELQGTEVLVGGISALEADSTDALYSRFPIVIAIILTASFLLLIVLLRSILVPLASVAMNLLSVLAAYGLLVLVFQKGLGEGPFGFTSIEAINWVTPVFLFAVLFGLSMDYQVFLVSRIRELRDRGYSNEEAVALGLERTGRVIVGAAAIMVVVFGAFLLSQILMIKEIGFALAAAVLLDATVVRIVMVPATLRLLGERSWWLPGWLARILSKVELEKEVVAAPPVAELVPGEITDGGLTASSDGGSDRQGVHPLAGRGAPRTCTPRAEEEARDEDVHEEVTR